MKKPPKRITEKYLSNAGQFYLSRFTASSGHFKTVMMRKIKKSCDYHKEQDKEACIKMLDQVTAQFVEQGLLNDELYAQVSVNSLRQRGLSRKQILNRLRIKGLEQDIVIRILNQYDEDIEEPEILAAAKFCKRKKIGPYSSISFADMKDKNKQLGKLARAGFDFDTAQKTLNLSEQEAEDILATG